MFCSGARGSYPRTARTPPYYPGGMPRSARSLDSIKGLVSAWLDTSARVCYIIITSSCWQISVSRAHLHFSLRPLSRRAQDVFLFSAFPRGANSVSSSDGIIAAVGSTDTSLQRVSLQLTPLNSARSKGCRFNLHPLNTACSIGGRFNLPLQPWASAHRINGSQMAHKRLAFGPGPSL